MLSRCKSGDKYYDDKCNTTNNLKNRTKEEKVVPYIKDEARLKLDREGASGHRDEIAVLARRIENCGEFNYVIFRLALEYLKNHGEKYQRYNDVVGAFDNAKDEFRRRKQHQYEDTKIEENGDVT